MKWWGGGGEVTTKHAEQHMTCEASFGFTWPHSQVKKNLGFPSSSFWPFYIFDVQMSGSWWSRCHHVSPRSQETMPPESPLFFGMHPNAEIDFRTKMWPGWYQLDMPGRNHRFQKVQWVRHVNFAPGYGWIWHICICQYTHIWYICIYYIIYIYIYIYVYIYDIYIYIYPPNSESLGRFISWLMLAHCTTLQVLQIADLAPATISH